MLSLNRRAWGRLSKSLESVVDRLTSDEVIQTRPATWGEIKCVIVSAISKWWVCCHKGKERTTHNNPHRPVYVENISKISPLCWGVVFCLFVFYPQMLTSSLYSSTLLKTKKYTVRLISAHKRQHNCFLSRFKRGKKKLLSLFSNYIKKKSKL